MTLTDKQIKAQHLSSRLAQTLGAIMIYQNARGEADPARSSQMYQHVWGVLFELVELEKGYAIATQRMEAFADNELTLGQLLD